MIRSSRPFSDAFDAFWRDISILNAAGISFMYVGLLMYQRWWCRDTLPLFTSAESCLPQLRELDQYHPNARDITVLPSGQYISFTLPTLGPDYEIWVELRSPSITEFVSASPNRFRLWLFYMDPRAGKWCRVLRQKDVEMGVGSLEVVTPDFVRRQF